MSSLQYGEKPNYSTSVPFSMNVDLTHALANYLACVSVGTVSTKQPVLLPGEDAVLIKKKVYGNSCESSGNGTKIDVYLTQYRLLLVETKTLILYPTMVSIWMKLGASFTPYDSFRWGLTKKMGKVRICQPDKDLVMAYQNERNTTENRGFLTKIRAKVYAKKRFIVITKCKELCDQVAAKQFQPIEVDQLIEHINRASEEDIRLAHGIGTL
jgi:hypothetical protein